MCQTGIIGLLCGSFRGQNGAGITSWMEARLTHLQAVGRVDPSISFINIDTSKPPFPLGPLYDNLVPAMIQSSSDYPHPAARQWSELVKSLSGLLIVSPQYNWGYPGELKNCFDHIYNEWKDMPIAVATYGGHGGNKAGAQLRQVIEGGLKANLISQGEVEITLPKSSIVAGDTVGSKDAEQGGFLSEYETAVDDMLLRLVEAAKLFVRT